MDTTVCISLGLPKVEVRCLVVTAAWSHSWNKLGLLLFIFLLFNMWSDCAAVGDVVVFVVVVFVVVVLSFW